MQSESNNLEKNLLNHLECPVCTDYLRPPITLCANGHNICSICKSKMRHCPTCRKKFLKTRNLSLEDIARQVMYPCKYRSHGCTETFNHDMIVVHQAKCLYSPQVCPVAKMENRNCGWTGNYNDIKEHLEEKHFEKFWSYVKGGNQFFCRLTDLVGFSAFIFAHNEIFFPSFLKKNNIFHVVVFYIGSAENAAKFKYKMEFVKKDDTEGVTFMYLTRSFDENLRDIYRSGNCGKLHYDVAIRLKDEEGDLMFKLEIIKVGT